ncbi:MAG: PilZ domain-containing protein [Phycisphaerae bacterium]
MLQLTPKATDRRAAQREHAAFTFVFTRHAAARQIGGWMLSVSDAGGVFIVSTVDAPKSGERIQLADLTSSVPPRVAIEVMPRVAEVVRVDIGPGRTARVAFRFSSLSEDDGIRPFALMCRTLADA